MRRLKLILDQFYRTYDFSGRIVHDPITFPHRYKFPRDIEAAGFIASCLSYGRVDLFGEVIAKILVLMGASPYGFLLDFSLNRQRGLFEGIKYRFNEYDDIVCLLFMLHRILRKNGSLENAFCRFLDPADRTIERSLAGFVNTFLEINTTAVYGRNVKPAGLTQFFPSPVNGSPCKRANLFLRWMVRDRDIDFGIWKGIDKKRLIIPLDTHIARISQCIGLTRRLTQDWKMAVEITESLKGLDPEDPLKYDFALCHHGISGLCKGKTHPVCRKCTFIKIRS